MSNTDQRSPCPVSCFLDLLGDRWTLLILRDLLLGKTHFKEFMASPEGISTAILSRRLTRMVEAGLVEKIPSTDVPGKKAYRLTPKGQSLGPIVKSVAQWGLNNIEGTQTLLRPLE